MISVENIEKSFRKLQVLKGVNLKMSPGKIYAFLGPNGSGKTTLLKHILGLVKPDQGLITINGADIKNGWEYRKQIGYMPQIANFPENLNIEEILMMVCNVRGISPDFNHLIQYFQLKEHLKSMLKNLSGGMKQKVNAIMALMSDPDILIFDEPSTGLDPLSHLKLKQLIKKEKDKGKTIMITTHILSEVEELADEIIFLLDGKIFFQGPVDQLLHSQEEDTLERAIARITNKDDFERFMKHQPENAL
ncbi:ABC transporter ATP-binding protein [Cytophagaceae bacterium ABcell3]|nr:ABC transporter ATP-binding protein [Cytophagaceae bacterium ABcell3]